MLMSVIEKNEGTYIWKIDVRVDSVRFFYISFYRLEGGNRVSSCE